VSTIKWGKYDVPQKKKICTTTVEGAEPIAKKRLPSITGGRKKSVKKKKILHRAKQPDTTEAEKKKENDRLRGKKKAFPLKEREEKSYQGKSKNCRTSLRKKKKKKKNPLVICFTEWGGGSGSRQKGEGGKNHAPRCPTFWGGKQDETVKPYALQKKKVERKGGGSLLPERGERSPGVASPSGRQFKPLKRPSHDHVEKRRLLHPRKERFPPGCQGGKKTIRTL